MLKSEKPGFLFRVNTLVKSLFNDTNDEDIANSDPLAKHNDNIINSLQNSYYLSAAFGTTEPTPAGSAKKLPIGLSMNEQKQKIVKDMLKAAKAKQDNHEIINLKLITQALALEYQGTPFENLLNLMLNNDSHINFAMLLQKNLEFIQKMNA